jgi:hypothetical protein
VVRRAGWTAPLDCFSANLLRLRQDHVIQLFTAADGAATRRRAPMQLVLDETTDEDHFLRRRSVICVR